MTDEPFLRCSSCGVDYIAGTVLSAECMGTDLRPITEPPEAPPEEIANDPAVQAYLESIRNYDGRIFRRGREVIFETPFGNYPIRYKSRAEAKAQLATTLADKARIEAEKRSD